MDARELRLGNFVFYGESIRLITAIHYAPQRKSVGVDNILTTFDAIKPIPLDPDILEKAGFELISKHSYWNFKNKIGFIISMWMEDDQVAGFEKKGACYWGEHYTEITYLHQLQNLHFIIVGKELEISL